MKEKIRNLYADHLFKNSFFLMLNTGVMAIFGFAFWTICSHLFSPDQIGIASTLISAMTLISYVSLLGLNTTFVRKLPMAENRNNLLNTGIILSLSVSIIIAIGYAILVPHIVPALSILNQNTFYFLSFILIVVFSSLNLLTDSIFIAFRSAKYNLLIDGIIIGVAKIGLPFALVILGAYGVFSAAGIASAIGMIASIAFLVSKFDYKPQLKIDWRTFKESFGYSVTNYIANLLNIIPTLILPFIVINFLGSEAAGYYYLTFMMANLLYAVAFSISQALFAEGSYGEIELNKLIKKSILVLSLIMIPSAIALAFLGPYVLQIFGKSYSVAGKNLLVILSLAAPAVAAYTLGNGILRLTNQILPIVIVNVVYSTSIILLAILWSDSGLLGIGLAWIIGNLLSSITAGTIIIYMRNVDRVKVIK